MPLPILEHLSSESEQNKNKDKNLNNFMHGVIASFQVSRASNSRVPFQPHTERHDYNIYTQNTFFAQNEA